MADHSNLSVGTTYALLVAQINDRLHDAIKGLRSGATTPTNLPASAVRFNDTSKKWESWSGAAWSDLAAEYGISINGSAATLTTQRAFSINGDGTATAVNFNGSGNVVLSLTLNTVPANKGGTGFASYAIGDILYASSTTTLAKRAKGADGQIFAMVSGLPDWVNPSSISVGSATTAGSAGSVTNGVYTIGNQTIAGIKTFSSPIVGSVTGSAASITGINPLANGGTGSSTQAGALTNLGALTNGVAAKDAAYTVVAGDRGKVFECTSTFTLSLTAVSTLGAGFAFGVRNHGTGVITIDPSGTQQIDGATTLVIPAGHSCFVVCNGTAWETIGLTKLATSAQTIAGTDVVLATHPAGVKAAIDAATGALDTPGMVLLTSGTISSAVSALALDLSAYSAYENIKIVLTGLNSSNIATYLRMRFSANGGLTWITSGYQWATAGRTLTESDISDGVEGNGIPVLALLPASDWMSYDMDVEIDIFKFFAAERTRVNAKGGFLAYASFYPYYWECHGVEQSTTAKNAIQFAIRRQGGIAVNITSGSYKVYGWN